MAIPLFRKDPDAVLNYSIDWEEWLESGDTISVSTWTVPTGITKDSDSKSSTATTIVLSSGTAGETYRLVNHITTADGLEDDRSFDVYIEEK